MKCGRPKHGSGLPCQRGCAPGFTACNLHGGANPSAKIKAEQMLAQARMPACEALFDIIEQSQHDPCVTCGYPKHDSDEQKILIRAAQVILDRTGMGPRSTVDMVPQRDGDLDLDLLTDEETARLDFLLTELKTFKEGVRVRLNAIAGIGTALAVPSEQVN